VTMRTGIQTSIRVCRTACAVEDLQRRGVDRAPKESLPVLAERAAPPCL